MDEVGGALITAAELSAHLHEVVLLDVQYALAGTPGPDLYAREHLPGAHFVDLDSVLADPPGERGRHPLPTLHRLQNGLRKVGLHDDSSVVVYDQRTSLGAARAWWVLRWAGFRHVRVLDGGLAAWSAAGWATTREVPSPEVGTLTLAADGLEALEVDDVLPFIAAGGALLDARTAERFRGASEPIDTEAGHIPGAVNLPIAEVLLPDGRFAPPAMIRSTLGEHGIPLDRPIGTSCGSGITACQLALALHVAGVPSRPFIGSWSEWIRDPRRPRETGDA